MSRTLCILTIWAIAATCRAEEAVVPDEAIEATPVETGPSLFANIDYLNWQARGTIWSLAPISVGAWTNNVILDSNHNSGVRVNLGCRLSSDWDVGWRYTYFSSPAGCSSSANFSEPPFYSGLSGHGQLNYNVFDLEVGHTFSGRTIDWRPFGSIRWAGLELDRDVQEIEGWRDYRSPPRPLYDEINSLNAYGLGGGGEMRWHLGQTGLSLFARGALYSLIGFDNKQAGASYRIELPSLHNIEAVPVMETAMGLGWRRGQWELSGGYEVNVWPSVFHQVISGSDGLNDQQNLILDGFFVRMTFSR